MERAEIRKAYHQAKYDEKNSGIFFLECSLIAVIMGLYFKSWAWGFGSFVGILILLQIKAIQFLLALMFIILWTFLGWSIGKGMFGWQASIFTGILAFIVSLGVHFSALAWIDDFSDR